MSAKAMASWTGIGLKANNKLIAMIGVNRMLDILLFKNRSFKSHIIKLV